MKSIFMGFGLVLCMILSIVIVLTLNGRSTRNNELQKALNTSIEETVRHLQNQNTYAINNNDEFIDDFMEALLVQINSDSTITVNVLGIDYEKGLLSVEVLETYKHPNGNTGSVSAVRTVIMEKYTVIPPKDVYYTLTYQAGDETYKTYTLKEGTKVIVPAEPVKEGAQFLYWVYADGTRADLNTINMTKDIMLYSKFSK